jgi:hypothetical protein
MQSAVQEGLDVLRALGTPEQMWRRAARAAGPPQRLRANAHVHLPPNFSAFDSVEQVVDLAAEQGLGVLGVSNYYDYAVYGPFVAHARRRGVFPLFGLEIIALIDELVAQGVRINDPNNPGRIYICGKGITRFDALTDRAAELLGLIRRNDAARMAEMTAKVAAIFRAAGAPTGLDDEAIVDRVVARHACRREAVVLQERHVAQAFQEVLFERVPPGGRAAVLAGAFGRPSAATVDDPVAVQGEIRSRLMKAGRPAFVEESFLTFREAYELILELGGIPCYPTLADGAEPICPYEDPPAKLIENLRGLNVHAAEFIPVRNSPEVLGRYARAMRAAGVAALAGTEHNTPQRLPFELACAGGRPIPEDLKDIFWEGACVAAAHQFLTLHGACGFVDARGRPHDGYATAGERVEAFARLGAAVIQEYRRRHGA